MGREKKWAMALALIVGLGCAALVQADDDGDVKPAKTGNWFTRMFTKAPAKKDKEAEPKKVDPKKAPPQISYAVQRQMALAEWERRDAMCLKLTAIANQTGDTELARKADQLSTRAWDIYVQKTGSVNPGNLSPDEQILDGKLGLGAVSKVKTPNAAVSARKVPEPRTAQIED